MATDALYSDDIDSQSEALERDAENLTDEARLYGCPTHEVWQHRGTSLLDTAERVLKEINQVREGIAFIISEAVNNGWDTEKEDQYLALSAKEDELSLSLI